MSKPKEPLFKIEEPALEQLRKLPVDQRAQVICAIFKVATSEFARLILEYSKPASAPKKRRKP